MVGSSRGKGSGTYATVRFGTGEARLPSLVSEDRSYKPMVKSSRGKRESDGVVVLMIATRNAAGGKGPAFGHVGGGVVTCEDIAGIARSAQRLGPIVSKQPGVIGAQAMAESVADYFVGHHPCMPGACHTLQALDPPDASKTVKYARPTIAEATVPHERIIHR